MKSLPINRPTLDDPIYSQKNPYQAFLLFYGVIVTLPVIFGGQSGSGSLDAEYGKYGVLAWAICLALGSLMAAVGEFWRGHTWNGLTVEAGGCALLTLGGGIFAFALLLQGEEARSVGLLVLSYALASAWRVGQIIRRLKWLKDLIAEINRAWDAEGLT